MKFMVEVMGARVWKVHAVIRFECSPILADWMRESYEERLVAKREGRAIDAEMLKLVMNSIYGKLCQNQEGFVNSSVYTSRPAFVDAINGCRAMDFYTLSEGGDFEAARCTTPKKSPPSETV